MQTTTKSFVGQAFEELSIEEMEVLQGSGDVQPLSSPVSWIATALSAVLCFPGSVS
ncbi:MULTISPECIES: lichenicidin A2 family type 2 lantibiotic [Carnobacterium]|uniref:lichenicidin A2 family type 2 lantibiotic n=1 Tax=Carnobacterium TaxID=2747 RepID=UPI0010721CA2|nr:MULTISPECIES: lichenicidin A2 family type 2 lantibiotic [Carnobacterium]MDT1940758.1 lichenicidin A2 family type 2 lantibiotic [Carnobacterium divergens]MDT1943196.1 lichenicidin A2 family type 2 lantibiotic [Carnobacterium divergens]MDT1949003.1 lichenicidin A2 family type 2 lantibiotic [Carnobacterium divergens]MDT1951484.1 lichenicidin A2 family type 2 lantibiotic [Carnobacterium divergens]MDT1956661.1 lichenicidin A2 family type 2 lantibiotic [Carnobacterium divergens]